MIKKAVNIVWFKRDLRFTDHEPLFMAQQENIPILLVYFFEPSVMAYHDSDTRHWRFVHESLHEMNEKLKPLTAHIHIFHNEVETVFNELVKHYDIKVTILGHLQRGGSPSSFDRILGRSISGQCVERLELSFSVKENYEEEEFGTLICANLR